MRVMRTTQLLYISAKLTIPKIHLWGEPLERDVWGVSQLLQRAKIALSLPYMCIYVLFRCYLRVFISFPYICYMSEGNLVSLTISTIENGLVIVTNPITHNKTWEFNRNSQKPCNACKWSFHFPKIIPKSNNWNTKNGQKLKSLVEVSYLSWR